MNKGFIYVVRNDNLPDKIYVGSTQKNINERFQKHRWNYNAYKKGQYPYYSVYELMKEKDTYIELLDEIYFDDINDLRKREFDFIEHLGNLCINMKMNKLKNKKNVCCPCCNHQFII